MTKLRRGSATNRRLTARSSNSPFALAQPKSGPQAKAFDLEL